MRMATPQSHSAAIVMTTRPVEASAGFPARSMEADTCWRRTVHQRDRSRKQGAREAGLRKIARGKIRRGLGKQSATGAGWFLGKIALASVKNKDRTNGLG